MYSMPDLTMRAALAELHVRGEDVAEGRVFVARHDDGQVRLGRGEQPALVGVALVGFGGGLHTSS
jgi:hypothetical protein